MKQKSSTVAYAVLNSMLKDIWIDILKLSMRNHSNVTCDVCFGLKMHLKTHILSIHEGKKFHCNICSVKFTSKQSLTAHISSVHEGKFLECDRCGAKFAVKRSLKRHIECDM